MGCSGCCVRSLCTPPPFPVYPQCTSTSARPSGTAAACVSRRRGSSSAAGAAGRGGAPCGTTAPPPTRTPPAGSTCPPRTSSAPTHASPRSVPTIPCLPTQIRFRSILSCHEAVARPQFFKWFGPWNVPTRPASCSLNHTCSLNSDYLQTLDNEMCDLHVVVFHERKLCSSSLFGSPLDSMSRSLEGSPRGASCT